LGLRGLGFCILPPAGKGRVPLAIPVLSALRGMGGVAFGTTGRL